MRLGDAMTIEAVSDGSMLAQPTRTFAASEESWLPHRDLLDERGLYVLEMGGFLVRTEERTVLVDLGIGPFSHPRRTGTFLLSLAALGVGPSDVTDVVLTHLHFDHVGWASDGEQPTFPNAVYRCHQADWDHFMGANPCDESGGVAIMGGRLAAHNLTPITSQLETWSNDVTVVPGIAVRSTPGHTPGSTVIALESGAERAVLLGDVAHCPLELVSEEWEFFGDLDRELARRSRETVARELEGTTIRAAGAHFPGMQFGRLLRVEGKRQWRFD